MGARAERSLPSWVCIPHKSLAIARNFWNTNSLGWTPFYMGAHDGLMMTPSNGNIFRLTGHLCGEFTGPGEFPAQRPVTRSFDVFFDLHLNKRLSKQWWGWWFETLSCPFWRHRNVPYLPSTKHHADVVWMFTETILSISDLIAAS